MEVILLCLVFLFGICVGSFLGVVTDRLPQGKNIVLGRSHCDFCKKTLSVLDLIPLFSFLFLQGRCRYCHKRLSYFYPTIEIITGILFVIVFIAQGMMNYEVGSMRNTIELIYYFFIVSVLVVIFFIDLKYGIIPFPIIFPATIIAFFYLLVNTTYYLPNYLFAALGAFLFFLTLFLATRGRGMGFGDVVFAFFMGIVLGFPKIILGLYIAFVGGALIALVLIALKKKTLQGSTLPFGPFLVVGTIVSLFWGDALIRLTFNVLQFTIK